LSGALLAVAPAPLATADNAKAKSTSPACPLQCPADFKVKAYSWELHPERTIYDDLGKPKVAEDSLWPVSCELFCEQHAPNAPTKEWKQSKELCKSGAEPKTTTGLWRNKGPWGKLCESTAKDGCGMQCYAVKVVKPTGKKPRGKGGAGK
jgi:hypothetical protein